MTATNEGWCHPASFIAASIHGSMFLMQQEMQQTHTETETELRFWSVFFEHLMFD